MEGVLYSELPFNQTVDVIEILLSLECINIWVWIASHALYKTLMKEEWENEVHLFYSPTVNSTGDCLREMYLRDESRGNLLIIGDAEFALKQKLSIHKNVSRKNIGSILFADGNVGYEVRKGRLVKYGWQDYMKKGQALDIAYCMPLILGIFYDNFDCDTFHDLLLANPVGHSFGVKHDNRLLCFISPPESSDDESEDFMSELGAMVKVVKQENLRLELNSLRMAHGLLFGDLVDALKVLGRDDLIKFLE